MRPKMKLQMTTEDYEFLSVGHLFKEDPELEKMSAALDEVPEILDEVAKDLHEGLKDTGALGMSVDQVLRSAVIYMLKCYSYRELANRLGSDYNFRKFTRFYGREIPDFSNLEKAIKRIRPQTWERLKDLSVALAIKKNLEDGARARGDTAVAETNIHYPTDASLLWDSVRVLDRLMAGVREELPQCKFVYHDRTRRAKRRSNQITMGKGKDIEKKRERWYRDLLKVSIEVVVMARALREALHKALENKELYFTDANLASFIKSELDHYLPLAEQCISQCQRRVKDGEKVPAQEKIVSIFEPHTDIIRRGKTMSPTEFGHKVMVVTGKSGLVLQYKVCEGNPPDSDLFEGILQKHVEQFGKGPSEFTADRRFYHEDNEKLAAEKPYCVERLAIPKPGRRSAQRVEFEKQRWFKMLLRFRAGIEGGLSTLLRCFGLGRCLWRGESLNSWVGLSFFAWNLRKIAALT
jgi:IS5 family transposase